MESAAVYLKSVSGILIGWPAEATGLLAIALLSTILWKLISAPRKFQSKNYHSNHTARYRALRRKAFFPGFANGWHAVCNAEDVANGQIKSISALGTHMVAFRGENGKVGVLDAFCPHLGAHLGQGGVIDGNLIVCPFHNWSFNCEGKCERVPYMRNDAQVPIPDRTSTKSYPVREMFGQILVWFHAEKEHAEAPLYEPAAGADLQRALDCGSWYFACMRTAEFDMHSCEMAMNSADQHHFDTLHSPFPIPVVENLVTGVHKTTVEYGKGIVEGAVVDKKEYTKFIEKTKGLYLFGNSKLPLPLSEWLSSKVDTTVIFEGPTVIHFHMSTPFGRLRQVMTLLSIEPFKQYVESRWFAENSVPRWVVNFVAYIGARALDQDRQVWENKTFRMKPVLVNGDGPFPAFIRWYGQFYSDSSRALEGSPLDW